MENKNQNNAPITASDSYNKHLEWCKKYTVQTPEGRQLNMDVYKSMTQFAREMAGLQSKEAKAALNLRIGQYLSALPLPRCES